MSDAPTPPADDVPDFLRQFQADGDYQRVETEQGPMFIAGINALPPELRAQLQARLGIRAADPAPEPVPAPVEEPKRTRAEVMMDLVEDVATMNAMVRDHGKILAELELPAEIRGQLIGGFTAMIMHQVIIHR